jgi:hypothetical protein
MVAGGDEREPPWRHRFSEQSRVTTIKGALVMRIRMLVVSLDIASRHRDHVPTLITSLAVAVVSAWMIVASQVAVIR